MYLCMFIKKISLFPLSTLFSVSLDQLTSILSYFSLLAYFSLLSYFSLPFFSSLLSNFRLSADCSVANGGCSANATCGTKADGTTLCSCESNFIGDGYTCDLRTAAQELSLLAQITYPVALSSIAPTLVDQLVLQSELIAEVAVAVNVSLERFAYYQLQADTNSFEFIFTIAPPLLPSDPTAATLQTELQAAVAAGKLNITSSSSAYPVAASAAASTSSTSLYPSTNPSSSSGSSWTVTQTLYVVIAVAGFLGVVTASLLLVIMRRWVGEICGIKRGKRQREKI